MDPRANWLLLCFNFKDDWILFGIAHIIRVLVAVVNIGDNPAIWFASIVLDFLRKKILMMLIDSQRIENKENSNGVKSLMPVMLKLMSYKRCHSHKRVTCLD